MRLVLILVVAAWSCTTTSTSSPPAETPAPTPATHEGAWFGSGEEFPDGALCVIVCGTGRLFLGDSPCDRTDRSDFQRYMPYTRDGDRFTLEWDKVPEITLTINGPTQASLTVLDFEGLPMVRVGDEPPLCDDPSIGPMPRDQK